MIFSASPATVPRGPRVLVVEDSPTQALQYALLLESAGLQADRRATVAAGVEAARAGDFDLLVVDVNLPDATGFDLCGQVRGMDLPRRPWLLLVTADSDPAHALRGLEAGADGFASKQDGPARLLGRVQDLLSQEPPREPEELPAVDMSFRGQRFSVRTDRRQLLSLLVAVFEDQVRAAELLRERSKATAATLASVLDTVPSGILVTDPLGRPVSANPRARALFGLGPDDLPSGIPSTCSFAAPNGAPMPWSEAPPAQTSADGRGRPPSELQLVRADGSRGDVLVSTGAVFDDLGNLARTVTSLQPITELKDSERDLARSRAFLQATIDALAERVVVLSAGGHIVATNRGWRRFAAPLFGGPEGVGVGAHLVGRVEALADGGLPAWRDLLNVLRQTLSGRRERVDVELRLGEADGGSWLLVRTSRFAVDGEDRVLLSVADISRRRRAEEAARAAEVQLRELLDRLPMPAAVVRWPDVVLANAAARQLFDAASEPGPSGVDLRAVLDEEAQHMTQAAYHQALASSTPVEVAAAALRAPSPGSGVAALPPALAVGVDFGGAPAVLFCPRPEVGIPSLDASMVHNDRMASLGTLAAGVAHEINNPMTYVMASLEELDELARSCSDDVATKAEFLDRVAETRDGAGRVVEIVRGLLTFGREDVEAALAPVDVGECVRAAVRLAGPELRYRAVIDVELAETAAVLADANQLTQVVLNLLVNAAHAMPEGELGHNRITVRCREEGGQVRLEVEDNGCGIDPTHMDRLFDPFFTTKPIGVGSGLGLSICQNLVRRFGGEIAVAAQPGLGTTFRVRLPASELPLPGREMSGEFALPGDAPAAERRLLVVDDDPGVGTAVGRMLKRLGQVLVVQSGREAIEVLSGGATFDLVLTDLLMADIDGMGLFEWIVEHRPELAGSVLLLTGGAFTARARQFVADFPNECLAKPVKRNTLLGAVERMLVRAQPAPGGP